MTFEYSVRTAQPSDYERISVAADSWWGERKMSRLLQPLFLENFSTTSLVSEADGQLVGFLIGFPSLDDPRVAYVHFVGVAPKLRGRGSGRALYEQFDDLMSARGVTSVRCVTSIVNSRSVEFHQAIGFHVDGYTSAPGVDGGQYVQMSRSVTDRPSPVVDISQWPPSPATRLLGEYVEVSPTVVDDSAGLYAALDDERVWTHLTTPRPSDIAEMKEQVVEAIDQRFPWTVRLARDYQGLVTGSVVGWSSYLEVSTGDARLEIGSTAYAPEVWRTAVNSETKLLLCRHAFEELGCGRVQLKTDIRNVRSQRGIEGIGARREGVLRWYQRRLDGTLRDTVVYSITRDEWPDVRDRLTARLSQTVVR